MKIQESAEDYLEAILFLGKSHEHVRSIDVVHHLGLSKPSVSVYLKNLRVNGYINVDDKGFEIAVPLQSIFNTHRGRHEDRIQDLRAA